MIKDLNLQIYKTANTLTHNVSNSIKIVNVLLVFPILVLTLIFIKHYRRNPEVYFARSVTGNKINMLPLRKFNVSPRSLLNWAMVATTNAYTLDFETYGDSLKKISEFFTKDGFEQFKQSLEESGRLQEIIEKKLISSAVVVDYPVIVAEGMQGVNYFWKMQIPIAVTFQGASEDIYKQWLIVSLLIKKVENNKELQKGIGIEKMSSAPIAPMY